MIRKHALTSKAFTLVELLVVIGIIALLISMLLPALGRARASANDTACLANLRQIGQAFAMYADQYKNVWPRPARPVYDEAWHKDWIYPFVYRRDVTPSLADKNAFVRGTIFECPSARGNVPASQVSWVLADDHNHVSYGMSARINDPIDATVDGRNQFKYPGQIRNSSETCVVLDNVGPWAGTLTTDNPYNGPKQPNKDNQLLRLQAAAYRHRGRINVLFADYHAAPLAYESIPKLRSDDDWWQFWAGHVY